MKQAVFFGSIAFMLCLLLQMTCFHVVSGLQMISDGLLLVVGDVTTESARVLFQGLNSDENKRDFQEYCAQLMSIDEDRSDLTMKLHEEKRIQVSSSFPQIAFFSGLKPCTEYWIVFHVDEDKLTDKDSIKFIPYQWKDIEEQKKTHVHFRTLSLSDSDTHCAKSKIIALSCNRIFEDEDEDMWRQLVADESDRDGIVHLGDQLYADSIFDNAMRAYKSSGVVPSQIEFVTRFRRAYTKNWGSDTMQRVLRHGANWMMPDDHDVLNNLDREMIEACSAEHKDCDEGRNILRRRVVEAGRIAFYEYQFQLLQNITEESKGDMSNLEQRVIIPQENRVHFVKKFAGVCWLFTDTRFYRTFHFEKDSPLFGSDQLTEISRELDSCASQFQETVLFSSVPPLFNSELFAVLFYMYEQERVLTHPELINDTVRLLDIIADKMLKYPGSNIRIVSGDVHQFFNSKICRADTSICIQQVATSGITKGSTIMHDPKLHVPHIANRYFKQTKAGSWVLQRTRNHKSDDGALEQYLGRNYLVLQVDKTKQPILSMRGVPYKNETIVFRLIQDTFDYIPEVSMVVLSVTLPLILYKLLF